MNMKMIVLVGFATVVALFVSAGIPGLGKGVKKESATPKIVLDNRVAYDNLKHNLGIDDDDVSRIEALEIIAVKFAEIIGNISEDVRKNTNRIRILEQDDIFLKGQVKGINSQIDDIINRLSTTERQIKMIDEDQAKIYDWSNKIDDELHNKYNVNGIYWRLDALRGDVAKDLDNHSKVMQSIINVNADQDVAIRNLVNAIRSFR